MENIEYEISETNRNKKQIIIERKYNSIFHAKKSIIQNYIDARIIKQIENVNLSLF